MTKPPCVWAAFLCLTRKAGRGTLQSDFAHPMRGCQAKTFLHSSPSSWGGRRSACARHVVGCRAGPTTKITYNHVFAEVFLLSGRFIARGQDDSGFRLKQPILGIIVFLSDNLAPDRHLEIHCFRQPLKTSRDSRGTVATLATILDHLSDVKDFFTE